MKKKLLTKLIDEEKIKLIIKSINYSKIRYKDYVKHEKIVTENGKYHTIWNYVFTNIKESFSEFPYKCYKISRGKLWDFVVVYDQINCVLYVIMKENNFKKIKNAKDKDFHYIKVLNLINPFKKEKNKQMSFFPEDKKKKDYIKNDLEEMLRDIDGKVKVCVDILFSEKQGKVTSMSGNIFDYDLDEIRSYCWNEYITADINEITDTDDEEEIANEPINLPIRGHVKQVKEGEENNKEIIASKEKQKEKFGES